MHIGALRRTAAPTVSPNTNAGRGSSWTRARGAWYRIRRPKAGRLSMSNDGHADVARRCARAVVLVGALATVAVGAPGPVPTTRASVSSDNTEADEPSDTPSISANGRFVVFSSFATTLVPGDGNGKRNIFVRDRQTGSTSRVSVSTAGDEADGDEADGEEG